ncbi:MAG TPA: TonB-dependent receptor, partial [Bryobacteraceae bacterium]|nr:TonB-dependent receptor [Bryobacteraceae bacterium]
MTCRGKLLSLSALLATAIYGQGTTSRVTGTVEDPSGAAIVGATVTLTNEASNTSFETRTSETGTYLFEAIQVGNYTVGIEASGFRKFSSKGNRVSIGSPTTVNVRLEVGQVTEQVQVSAVAELVQTSTSGNIGNVLNEKTIKDMPIIGTRGRSPLQLILLQPGVVSGPSSGAEVHVHGARDRAFNYTLDGLDNNEASQGGGTQDVANPTRTNPDSIQEFRLITSNPTAENGRNSGAQVQIMTRSGSNEFHGSGFWFYRTPRLNANEWENNLNNTGKRQFVQNIYGASVGGPIIRNKTFFFYNQQRLVANETRSRDRLVYTAAARAGNWRFVQGGRNGAAGTPNAAVDPSGNALPGLNIGTYNIFNNDPQRLGIDPTVKALIDETPLPNNFFGGDGLNTAFYSFASPQFEKQRDQTAKIDHVFSATNTVFFRAAWGYQNTVCDAGNTGDALFPGAPCQVNTERSPRNLAFNWRWNPTPSVTNELVVGESKFTFNFRNVNENLEGFVFPTTPVTVGNVYSGAGNLRNVKTRQIVDNLSWIHGSHAWKFGTNLRFVQHNDQRGDIAGANAAQQVYFERTINAVDPATFGVPSTIQTANDLPELQTNINFLLGRVGTTNRGFGSDGERFVEGPFVFNARYNEYDFYAQDTWKLRRNLTIDLGLRWEIKMAPTEANNKIRVPSQSMVYGAAPSTSITWQPADKLFNNDFLNLGPSVGFAWDPFSDGRTSVRGNYRIAYDRMSTFSFSSAVFQSLPGLTLATTDTNFGQAGGRLRNLPRLTAPSVSPSTLATPQSYTNNLITTVDPDFETPTTQMWSFGLQREIPGRFVISADYIGRRAYNLFGAYNSNTIDVRQNGFLDAYNAAKAGGESALLDTLTAPHGQRRVGESGSAFLRRQFSAEMNLNNVAGIAQALSRRFEQGVNLPAASGLGPYFFTPFPQFQGGSRIIDSNDFSTYHGLELQIVRNVSSSAIVQFSYTWAKSLDTRSYDPVSTIYGTGSNQNAQGHPFDIANRRLNYGRSEFDRRHVFQSYWVYELPFGRNRRIGGNVPAAVDHIIGGWQVAGNLRYQTGRPFTVFSGSSTLIDTVQSTANCTGCSPEDGKVFIENGRAFYFDAALRAKFSAPAPGQLGNLPRNFFQTGANFNLNASGMKRIYITERFNFELRADATNVTNTPTWDFPTASITSTTFGRLNTPNSLNARK